MLETIAAVFTPANLLFMLKGLGTTLLLSVCVVLMSIVFGSILGILRSYVRIIGALAGIYIEVFRNTPLLLWMLACVFLVPSTLLPSSIMKAGLALFLYTASVIAEIVRGGLNAVPKGQFEAAHSQGFTFVQTLWYIVLPQAYRNIIPSLLSQVITTIKDTAFLASFGLMEFFRTGQLVIGQELGVNKTAQTFLIYAVLALTYFIVCFSLSCVVRSVQKKRAEGSQVKIAAAAGN